jgi:hypothetical protein
MSRNSVQNRAHQKAWYERLKQDPRAWRAYLTRKKAYKQARRNGASGSHCGLGHRLAASESAGGVISSAAADSAQQSSSSEHGPPTCAIADGRRDQVVTRNGAPLPNGGGCESVASHASKACESNLDVFETSAYYGRE